MKKTTFIYLATTLLVLFAACTKEEINIIYPDENSDDDEVVYMPLKDKATFNIGTATKLSDLSESDYDATVVEHFNQITAEYEMKMNVVWKGENSYDWTAPDALVAYAQENEMDVHGHVLLWYKSFPDWFATAQYDSAAFESNVEEYITAVVTRYKGKVNSWDVVNEVFEDNGSLRQDELITATFNDPIAFYGRCFQYARHADADVKLFYNDYSVALVEAKRKSILEMVTRFESEAYPIDGLGAQFHYSIATDMDRLQTGIDEMVSTGLLFHISELDLKVNVYQSNDYLFSSSEQMLQEEAYQKIVEMYVAIPEAQKFAITTWGVTDKYTWLTTSWHQLEYPLLFDKFYTKKKAFDGFLKGLE